MRGATYYVSAKLRIVVMCFGYSASISDSNIARVSLTGICVAMSPTRTLEIPVPQGAPPGAVIVTETRVLFPAVPAQGKGSFKALLDACVGLRKSKNKRPEDVLKGLKDYPKGLGPEHISPDVQSTLVDGFVNSTWMATNVQSLPESLREVFSEVQLSVARGNGEKKMEATRKRKAKEANSRAKKRKRDEEEGVPEDPADAADYWKQKYESVLKENQQLEKKPLQLERPRGDASPSSSSRTTSSSSSEEDISAAVPAAATPVAPVAAPSTGSSEAESSAVAAPAVDTAKSRFQMCLLALRSEIEAGGAAQNAVALELVCRARKRAKDCLHMASILQKEYLVPTQGVLRPRADRPRVRRPKVNFPETGDALVSIQCYSCRGHGDALREELWATTGSCDHCDRPTPWEALTAVPVSGQTQFAAERAFCSECLHKNASHAFSSRRHM